MAKKIAATNTNAILGGPALAAQVASLVQGVAVGLDSSGNVKLADYRASEGPVVCRGFLREDIQLKDPKGNVIYTQARASYVTEGIVGGLTGLTQGATYYLHSGGLITATKPASATNDVDQEVGWAKSATELVIKIGSKTVHA